MIRLGRLGKAIHDPGQSPLFSAVWRLIAMNWNVCVVAVQALFAAILLCPLAEAADRNALAAAAASITTGELRSFVDTLADDTFEGRETGSRGGRAAGNYLVTAFEQRGAKPAGDGGTYFQSFNGASRNILGLVEGSDPVLKNQVIVVGAHYDHVGYGRATNSFGPLGYIHNGADDNASGVAGLMEVLDAVNRLPEPPRRSILFACWDSEEGGLQGSRHWVSQPTIPLSRIVMAINVDMIGRMKNGRMEILGIRTGYGLRRIVSQSNSEQAPIHFDWRIKADSDHWPFFERRIPYVMFHTGLHENYHRPSDDAHLINHEGLMTASRFLFSTLVAVADAEKLPNFRDASRSESGSSSASIEQPATPQPPRYGMPFRVEAGDPPRVLLTDLTPGGAAQRAGLWAGDRLLEFQGQAINDEARLRLELLAARGETTFLVARPGAETPLLIKLTPSGEPVRVGITWRLDDAEPGTAIVTQVIYGSAAHSAGIKVADRVYSVGGQSFQTQDDFVRLLTQATGTVDFLLERDGRVRNTTLTLVDAPQSSE
jgi:hypothetical protein